MALSLRHPRNAANPFEVLQPSTAAVGRAKAKNQNQNQKVSYEKNITNGIKRVFPWGSALSGNGTHLRFCRTSGFGTVIGGG